MYCSVIGSYSIVHGILSYFSPKSDLFCTFSRRPATDPSCSWALADERPHVPVGCSLCSTLREQRSIGLLTAAIITLSIRLRCWKHPHHRLSWFSSTFSWQNCFPLIFLTSFWKVLFMPTFSFYQHIVDNNELHRLWWLVSAFPSPFN